jgi:hypothetical protein
MEKGSAIGKNASRRTLSDLSEAFRYNSRIDTGSCSGTFDTQLEVALTSERT